MTEQAVPTLEVRDITMCFGSVTALSGVSLQAGRGEIVGLIGVNGAGKSTLMNIIDGIFTQTRGEILVGGKPVRFANPLQARAAGIGFIHQHTTCFDELSVAENISIQSDRLGRFSRSQIETEALALLTRLGVGHLDPRARLASLTTGERQLVDVARVLIDEPGVLLFDEPTSSLSRQEAAKLFEVIRSLREEGRTVFYTSHFLDDVLDLADRIVVLRDGALVMDQSREGLTREVLVSKMLSRDLAVEETRIRPEPTGPIILHVEDLCPSGGQPVSFILRQGEVLGIWGLLGAGRTEILRALLGLEKGSYRRISVTDAEGRVRELRPYDLLREVGFVTEDRHHDGLFLNLPVWKNITAGSGRRYARRLGRMVVEEERRDSDRMIRKLSVKLGALEDPINSLSGGNQQKVLLARWLVQEPRIYMFDEPTHGVDVGAKTQIHDVIHEVADAGACAIIITSEVEEMFTLADRILVLRDGAFVGEMHRRDFDQQKLLAAS